METFISYLACKSRAAVTCNLHRCIAVGVDFPCETTVLLGEPTKQGEIRVFAERQGENEVVLAVVGSDVVKELVRFLK